MHRSHAVQCYCSMLHTWRWLTHIDVFLLLQSLLHKGMSPHKASASNTWHLTALCCLHLGTLVLLQLLLHERILLPLGTVYVIQG